jgi:hypothetical protein
MLLVGSNFHAWVLWPSIALVVAITRMWVKQNVSSDN